MEVGLADDVYLEILEDELDQEELTKAMQEFWSTLLRAMRVFVLESHPIRTESQANMIIWTILLQLKDRGPADYLNLLGSIQSPLIPTVTAIEAALQHAHAVHFKRMCPHYETWRRNFSALAVKELHF